MEKYCQNILNDDTKCEEVFKLIVDFIVSKSDQINIDDRKCFERKETTDFLINNNDQLVKYLKENMAEQ